MSGHSDSLCSCPPQLIGIEEPENYLHPRLLPGLAEECRQATASSQILTTSHSPFFLNGLKPEEVRFYIATKRGHAADMQGIQAFIEAGAKLGHLWMEGYFEVGNPLTASGGTISRP